MHKRGNAAIAVVIALFVLFFFLISLKGTYHSFHTVTGYVAYSPELFNLTFVDPTPANQATVTGDVLINLTSAQDLTFAWIELNTLPQPLTGSGKNWKFSFNTTGTFIYRAYGNDSQGNYGGTDVRTVTITAPPQPSPPQPAQQSPSPVSYPITFTLTNQTVPEDTPFPLNLTPFTVTNATQPSYSLVSFNTTYVTCSITSVSYLNCTPATNQYGTTNITLNASTNTSSALSSFLLTITPVNDVPVLIQNISSLTLNASLNITLNLSIYFRDTDGDPLHYDFVSGYGLQSLLNGSSYFLSSVPGFTGITNITFSASDGINMTTSNLVLVTVTAQHLPPPPVVLEKKLIPLPDLTMDKNIPYDLNLEPYFSAAGDHIDYRFSGLSHISGTLNGHVLHLIPEKDWIGTEKVTVTAAGSKDTLTSTEFGITVRSTENPPQLGQQFPPLQFTMNTTKSTLDLNAYFSDPDHEPLTYTANTSTNDLHIDLQGSLLTITLPDKHASSAKADILITATDPKKLHAQGTLTVLFDAELQQNTSFASIPFFISALIFIGVLIVGGYIKTKQRYLPSTNNPFFTKEGITTVFKGRPKTDSYKHEMLQTETTISVLNTLIQNCDDHVVRTSLSREKEKLQHLRKDLEREMDQDKHRSNILLLKETRAALYETRSLTEDTGVKEELDKQIKTVENILRSVIMKYKR